MRSGTTAWSAARRNWAVPAPSMRSVDEPAPEMLAPMRPRNRQRSNISGSRAALSITVVPLAATAAISRFSVAPTLGNSSTTRPPSISDADASMLPCTTSTRAPSSVRPRTCMSMGRGPKSSPPGRATVAFTAAGQHGPEDDDRCPEPLDDVVGGHRGDLRGHVDAQRGRVDRIPLDGAAHGPQELGHEIHIDYAGHVAEPVGALGQQRGRHELERRVLGPRHCHRALQSRAGANDYPLDRHPQSL